MRKRIVVRTKKGEPVVVTGTVVAGPRPHTLRPKRKVGVRRIARAALGPHATEVFARLKRAHPDAHCELDHQGPLQLLMATILSAQCTDKRVNMVTPALFARYADAESLASASQEELEDIIRSTGFFHNKAKSLIALGKALVERHGGEVPGTMEELVKLPGVGRKTANVVLGNAFNRNEGVVVDTHVGRLSVRLGFTKQTDAVKAERELMPLFPRDDWAMLAHVLIFHGRRVCDARAPPCEIGTLIEICQYCSLTSVARRD